MLQKESQHAVISVRGVEKVYASGFRALDGIELDIYRGEIFALLGPNGAGKTTLINIICGITKPTSGTITVDGHDVIRDYRASRAMIGLVPQEIAVDPFERVINTVRFSRGLFGKPPDPALLERVLRDLSLSDKRESKVMTLSGGMKRRLMMAKALSHEPLILFLDEPTAGVDVELRRSMWEMVRGLRARGVTIILTTHYIEEAQEMADRIGVINKGKIVVVDEKGALMQKLGKKTLTLSLAKPLRAIPWEGNKGMTLTDNGRKIVCQFDTRGDQSGIAQLFRRTNEHGITITDVQTRESSLEDIFVNIVGENS